jgi:hypothetical protein
MEQQPNETRMDNQESFNDFEKVVYPEKNEVKVAFENDEDKFKELIKTKKTVYAEPTWVKEPMNSFKGVNGMEP